MLLFSSILVIYSVTMGVLAVCVVLTVAAVTVETSVPPPLSELARLVDEVDALQVRFLAAQNAVYH